MSNDAGIVTAVRRTLIANGFQPIAVKTGEKVPLGMAWQMRRGLPPLSDAALNTGILCEGLCPADIDVDDADAVEAIVKIFDEVAGHSSLRRTRPNSSHCLLFYRAPDGTRPRKRVIKLGSIGKVEFLGLGQQFVAYGTHPTGVEFEWPEDGPDIVKRENMLVLTPEHEVEIERRLRATFDLPADNPDKPATEPIATSRAATALPPSRPDIGARERAAFEAALIDEVRKVSQAGEGQRNHTLNIAAFSLAQMVASGWGGQSEVDTALTEAALTCGLRQPEIRKTIASGFASGSKKPRPALDDREGYGDSARDIEIRLGRINGLSAPGEAVDDADDPEEDEVEAAPIDEALTHVDGVLGEMVDWIASCDPQGNRLLALAAALPLMGTLLGRRMATPTRGGGGLELYVISLLPTGEGKSVAMAAITRLLEVAGLDNQHLAPPKFRSGAAFGDILCQMPLSISIVDEVADYLASFIGERRQGHQAELEESLKEQWGHGFRSFRTTHSKTTRSVKAYAPNYSIYGVTAPEALFRIIKSSHITSGFINRFTVINADGAARPHKPTGDIRRPPDELIQKLRSLYAMGASGRGNLSTFVDKNAAVDPDPVLVHWQTQDAADYFDQFETECAALKKDLGDLGKIYGRTAFMAVKIATIRACGRGTGDLVTLADIEWGAALARQSADLFRHELSGKMLDPLTAGEMLLKVEQQFTKPTEKAKSLMARYGAMTLPRRFLFENLKRHINRHPGEFENALKAMQYGGQIEIGKADQAGAKDGVDVVRYLPSRRRKFAA